MGHIKLYRSVHTGPRQSDRDLKPLSPIVPIPVPVPVPVPAPGSVYTISEFDFGQVDLAFRLRELI